MPAGAIAVDAPALPQDARDWRKRVIDTTGGPILYLVLTDTHPDRLLGAAELEAPIVATREAYEEAAAYTDGFWRSVVDGWTRYYPEAADDLASARIILPEILFTADITLRKGGVDMTVTRIAGAAPGSAWVYLPGSDVLFSGDTMVAEAHPYMASAPDTEAWLKTLRTLRRSGFSATLIVPGRGELCSGGASRQLSEYIALARRRVRSLHLAERPRADTARLVAEFLPRFPTPDEARTRIQRQVKAGLDRVYDELRPE
jgi:glyoxylase-like metal-dependent hydrolase (beta-lactamase superfamily II)